VKLVLPSVPSATPVFETVTLYDVMYDVSAVVKSALSEI